MNLTNQQVNALARMLEDQHDEAQTAKIKAAEPTKEQVEKAKAEAKLHYQVVDKLPQHLRKLIKNGYNEVTVRSFEDAHIAQKFPKPTKAKFNREKAESKIIVTAMGCTTVDDLKHKLKIKEA